LSPICMNDLELRKLSALPPHPNISSKPLHHAYGIVTPVHILVSWVLVFMSTKQSTAALSNGLYKFGFTPKWSNHNTYHLCSPPDRSGVANELSRAAVSPSRLLLRKSGSFPWDPSARLLFSSHSWRICQLCWLTLPIRYETPELFSAISFRLVSIVSHMVSASTTAPSDSIVVAQYAGVANFVLFFSSAVMP